MAITEIWWSLRQFYLWKRFASDGSNWHGTHDPRHAATSGKRLRLLNELHGHSHENATIPNKQNNTLHLLLVFACVSISPPCIPLMLPPCLLSSSIASGSPPFIRSQRRGNHGNSSSSSSSSSRMRPSLANVLTISGSFWPQNAPKKLRKPERPETGLRDPRQPAVHLAAHPVSSLSSSVC